MRCEHAAAGHAMGPPPIPQYAMYHFFPESMYLPCRLRQIASCLLLSIALLASSCTVEQQRQSNMLPPARGGKGEVVLVMDSLQWKGRLGEAVRGVFAEPLPGLPQEEPMFSLTFVTASEFKSILRQSRNVVIVNTFDTQSHESRLLQQHFTEESRERIRREPDLFLFRSEDEYASGQQVLRLFSQTEDSLIAHLGRNRKSLQQRLWTRENEAARASLLSPKALNRKLSESLAERHAFDLPTPQGYQLAKDTAGFVWLRFVELGFDKNIIISYRPYTDKEDFSDERLIAWRNELGRRHIYADREEKPESYMVTEMRAPVHFSEIGLAGEYAKEVRGLWRLNGVFMGGPFVGYAFADLSQRRLYYVEGFLSAPSSKKREHLRELELLLKRFQPLPSAQPAQ
jgi:hypothetical protein